MRKIFLGLVPAMLALPSPALASQAWQVSESSGEVRLTHNGQSRAAVRGALLASGATIATGPKGRAVIVRGEEFVIISPRSQLRVPAADVSNPIMQMIEDFGTAVFKIKKKTTPTSVSDALSRLSSKHHLPLQWARGRSFRSP